MKQKLALACTLVHEPQLIVLDEPTTGVDPVSRREFWKLLSEFLSQGITIVMSTPYLDEAERCSRVALLHEGRLLALDAPDALRATLPGALFEVIVARPPPGAGRARAGSRASPTCRCSASGRTSDGSRGRRRPTARLLARRSQPPGLDVDERPADRAVARRRVHRAARRGTHVMKPRDRIIAAGASCADRRVAVGASPARSRADAAAAARSRSTTRSRAASTTSHRLAEAVARGDAAGAVVGAAARRDAAAGGGAGRLHAHQSRRRVRHPACRTASFAIIYPGHPGQLPHAARSAVADLHRRTRSTRSSARRAAKRRRRPTTSRRRARDLRLEITRAYWALRHRRPKRCAWSRNR